MNESNNNPDDKPVIPIIIHDVGRLSDESNSAPSANDTDEATNDPFAHDDLDDFFPDITTENSTGSDADDEYEPTDEEFHDSSDEELVDDSKAKDSDNVEPSDEEFHDSSNEESQDSSNEGAGDTIIDIASHIDLRALEQSMSAFLADSEASQNNDVEQPPLPKTFYKALIQGLKNAGLITAAFAAFNLANDAIDKDWPTNWEEFFSWDNLGTFIAANAAGALTFNIIPLWDLIIGLKNKAACSCSSLFHALQPYVYEITASFVGFIPYSFAVGAASVAFNKEELGQYEEITKLAINAFGALLTTTAIGKMKPKLDSQDLIPLFIALLITAYSNDLTKVSEAIADPSNPTVKAIFDSIMNAVLAVGVTLPYPALEFGAKKLVSYVGSFFGNNNLKQTEEENRLINDNDSNETLDLGQRSALV
jgi:hypothetical protein